jgi:hypothetical protein
MSERIEDGGPAFPFTERCGDGSHYHSHSGMTLRDYFAAKFAHAELMTCGVPGKACNALIAAAANAGRKVETQIAFNAYEMADAMLKAREAQS